MREITSKDNKIVKLCEQLAVRKYRDRLGLYLIEGENLLEEAVREDAVKTVIHGFTKLGILEMTRKRTSETLLEMLAVPCNRCGQLGYILPEERKENDLG